MKNLPRFLKAICIGVIAGFCMYLIGAPDTLQGAAAALASAFSHAAMKEEWH